MLEAQLTELGVDKKKISKKYKAAAQDIEEQKQKIIDEMKKQQALAQKRLDMLKGMLGKFKALIESGKLNVRIRNGKMVLESPKRDPVLLGKADFRPRTETLGEVASVLAGIKDREFQVAGHTADVPITNAQVSAELELSTARAVEAGVSPETGSKTRSLNEVKHVTKKKRRIVMPLMS